jgi:hypothetical protein
MTMQLETEPEQLSPEWAAEIEKRRCIAEYQQHTARWLGGRVAFCSTCGEVFADLPVSVAMHLELLQRVRTGLEFL